jgi:predicted RNA-binding protein with RPS1 domain
MIDPNKIVMGKVVRIHPTFAIINFNNSQGICHISEISDYHVSDIQLFLKLNETYPFYLISDGQTDNKCRLSFKQIRPKLLKFHREIIPTVSGYKNIYDFTMKELQK